VKGMGMCSHMCNMGRQHEGMCMFVCSYNLDGGAGG
jgi:hypothetical protein